MEPLISISISFDLEKMYSNCILHYTAKPGDNHGAVKKANCLVLATMIYANFLNIAKSM